MSHQPPNILLITSDQHRADTMACAGHPCVETPHLDLLAYQGMRFENAYVDCPVCIPARTTLVTGRRAHENGMPEYSESFRVDRARRDFLGSLLTAAGYQTELIGKTHWHTEADFRAGFEHVTWLAELRKQQLVETGRPGMQVGLGYNASNTALSPFPRHLHTTDWLVDRSIDFLAIRERGQPFALWVSMQDPHPPYTIHEPYYSMYDDAEIPVPVVPDWVGTDAEPFDLWCKRHSYNKDLSPRQIRKMRSVYYGMVTNLDHQIGRLIAQLQYQGDLDNTLIVYTSDHGEAAGDFGDFGKRTFLECSAKVPLIVRPPASWNVTPGQTNADLVEWADLLPTLCEVAGARVPGDVTGRSLVGSLRGEAMGEHVIHGQIGNVHMLRSAEHKYIYCVDDGSDLCFHTSADPRDEHPIDGDIKTDLRAQLVAHLEGEPHEHVRDGELVNLDRPRPSIAELRASNIYGLGPTQYLGDAQRSVQWIH